MSHRAAHDRSSASRKYDSGRPATVVDASAPHNSVLPVRGVAQIKYESKRPLGDGLSRPLPGLPTFLFIRQSIRCRTLVVARRFPSGPGDSPRGATQWSIRFIVAIEAETTSAARMAANRGCDRWSARGAPLHPLCPYGGSLLDPTGFHSLPRSDIGVPSRASRRRILSGRSPLFSSRPPQGLGGDARRSW